MSRRPTARGGVVAPPPVEMLVSGGQTGVDRAALDTGLALGLAIGGWIPRGRRTEDGPLPERYPLRETASDGYAERTRLNVRDADATLVLCRGKPTGGTALTLAFARRLRRPHLLIDLNRPPPVAILRAWLRRQGVRTLNVAGPRESHAAGIYAEAAAFLTRLLSEGTATERLPSAAGDDDLDALPRP